MGESANTEIQNKVRRATEVFDQYGDDIRAIIRFNVRNDSETEDIFQDFFLSIIRKPIPQDIQDVRGYLYRAITNDIIDVSRRMKSQRERIQKYAENHKYTISEEDPQQIVSQAEGIKKLFLLIEGQLPIREAEAVVQRYGCNLDTTDTAQKMSVGKRTVSRYLSVAMKKIRGIVHNDGDEYL